jgi:ribosomal protein S18 acetylase RimI-like enzyme
MGVAVAHQGGGAGFSAHVPSKAMDVVVSGGCDGWAAHRGGVAVGNAAVLVRPDARCFVVFGACDLDAYRPLVQAIARQLRRDLYTEIGEADAQVLQRLVGLGFVVNRREHIYTIATDPMVTGLTNLAVPAGFEILTADRVSEDRLRELDEELKQDVPGADGWQWDRQGFRKETYEAPDFDPATYLVAIEQATGRYAGLVRVWNRPSGPRLGLIGVGRGYRRRGLARLLLAQVFAILHQRGKTQVVAEVDVTNTSSNRLLISLGAHRTGGTIELIRPWPAAGPA